MTLVEFLQAVRDVIPTPRRWTKRKQESFDGQRHCIIGAIYVVARDHGRTDLQRTILEQPLAKQAVAAVREAIKQLYRDRADAIAYFNDHRQTQHRDVLRVLDTAIDKFLWDDLKRNTRRVPSMARLTRQAKPTPTEHVYGD
jgi:hypothetical protein